MITQNRAGEYLDTVHKQVSVLPIVEDVEKKKVQKISKWYNTDPTDFSNISFIV